jgi:hypothetical protein
MSNRIATLCAAGMFFLAAGCADSGRLIASTSSTTLKSAPTFVTVRGPAVQPAAALARIAEQSGVTFAAADDRAPLDTVGRNAESKALAIVNQPFWQAVLDVIAGAPLKFAEQVSSHGGTAEYPTASYWTVGKDPEATKARTIFLDRPSEHDDSPPPKTSVSNGFLITARRGSGWTSDGVAYVGLDLSARADPNVPAVYWELTQLYELTDADGQRPLGEFELGQLQSMWKEGVTSVPLSRNDEAVSFDLNQTGEDTIRGGRIAHIKGKGHVAVAVKTETLEVTGLARDPDQLKRRVWHVGGLRIEIEGLTKEKYAYSLTARAVCEGQSARQWGQQLWIFRSAPPALIDADGRGFHAGGTAAWGDEEHGRPFYEITYSVVDHDSLDEPGREPAPPRPVDRLVWEFPTQVRFVETPFDFTDVSMTLPERRPAGDASVRR